MNIKQILKDNGISQEEYASRIGLSRTAINLSLNGEGKQRRSDLDTLKLMIAEKRGVKIAFLEGKIQINIDLTK